MPTGTLQSIEAKKGFGFVRPEQAGPDVFFHKSACAGRFDQLTVGQQLTYELDAAADRPRAKQVSPSGRAPAGGPSRTFCARPENCRQGFITKIHVRDPDDPHGFISDDQGGFEVRFAPNCLQNASWFDDLNVGDYVEFACDPATTGSRAPQATYIQRVSRQIELPRTQLQRHPNARRKKPSWR